MMNRLLQIFLFSALCASCMKPNPAATQDNSSLSSGSGSYLYVATGACYSGGGNTTFTNVQASNQVYRVDTTSGKRDMLIADYYAAPANGGDSPVGLATIDNDLLVLVENTTTTGVRRIERVVKSQSGSRSTYSGNTTALSAQLRGMLRLNDGYLLVNKTTAIEKTREGMNRLPVMISTTAYPWVSLANPPATSNCIPNATQLGGFAVLNNGNIAFAHAANNANRIGLVSYSGYAATASCLNGNAVVNAPSVASSYPTSMVYDGVNNKLIVSYAGNSTAADINSIYAYPVNEATNTIGTGVKIYDANSFGSLPGWNYLLYGVSAMTLDSSTNSLYIATAINATANITTTGYRIEKLTYNPSLIGSNNYGVLSRVSGSAFYEYGSDTKCIAAMMLGN